MNKSLKELFARAQEDLSSLSDEEKQVLKVSLLAEKSKKDKEDRDAILKQLSNVSTKDEDEEESEEKEEEESEEQEDSEDEEDSEEEESEGEEEKSKKSKKSVKKTKSDKTFNMTAADMIKFAKSFAAPLSFPVAREVDVEAEEWEMTKEAFHKAVEKSMDMGGTPVSLGEQFVKVARRKSTAGLYSGNTTVDNANSVTNQVPRSVVGKIFGYDVQGYSLSQDAFQHVTTDNQMRTSLMAEATASKPTELGSVAFTSDGALTNETVNFIKYSAGFRYSFETTEDTQFDVAGFTMEKCFRAIRKQLEADIVSGVDSATATVHSNLGASTTLTGLEWNDLAGLTALVEGDNIRIYLHPSVIRWIVSQQDSNKRPLYPYDATSNTLNGLQLRPCAALGTATAGLGANAATVAICCDAGETIMVGRKANDIRVSTNYDEANDSFKVSMHLRGAVAAVDAGRIVNMKTRTA